MTAKLDVLSREVRERAALAITRNDGALALEACAMLASLFDGGYRIGPLMIDEPARPVMITTQYANPCSVCAEPIAMGSAAWWQAGVTGIMCCKCEKRRK